MTPLFVNEDTRKLLHRFSNSVEMLKTSSDFEKSRNDSILVVCKSMMNRSKDWDERCQISISYVGSHLTNSFAQDLRQQHNDYLDVVLALIFRFLVEYHMSSKREGNVELDRVRRFCTENISLFSPDAQDDINYATTEMPISIVKELLSNPTISSLKNLESTLSKFESIKNQWESELDVREAKASKLKDSFEHYKNAFNFVGLSEGFDKLAIQKREEMDKVLFWLRIAAILIVFPLLSEVVYVLSHAGDTEVLTNAMLLVAFPTISLVAILVYYFRVLLSNYKSIQSQLLQIELRLTLCRFIHNYSEYANDMKSKDNTSLEKFENMIFSSITPNSDNIPSTFDGVEQLSKLLKSVKQ
ncbi:hypothetical protein AB6D81_25685 [Vibrio splendidus]